MPRGWTWIDDNKEHDYDKLKPILDRLAMEWSQLTEDEERLRLQRQAQFEDGESSFDQDFDSEAEYQQAKFEYEETERIRVDQLDAKLRCIENALARHGARMMRPYEHWNEDEHLMEYMERDRD